MQRTFPHSHTLEALYGVQDPQLILNALESYILDRRKEKIEKVLDSRTFNTAIVMDKVHNMGNISAVMRSAEAFGFQPIYNINADELKTSQRTTKGAHKWLDTFPYDDRTECIKDLKNKGYQIVSTLLSEKAVPIYDINWTKPTAVVFGHEEFGVSEEMQEASDYHCILPTGGFTQSFNISVAAALFMFHIHNERMKKYGKSGDLTEEEKKNLRAIFYARSATFSKEKIELYLRELDRKA